ncbi:MAG: DNA mismatch endonuclease Vsr [Acidimicrobiales bacterium]
MADVVDHATRSRVMAAILPRGNRSTELTIAKALRARGLHGWRRHWRVSGRPDFAWPRLKVAVFADGCFWHGCSCRRAPKSNTVFWEKKIRDNRRRDHKVSRDLRSKGWKVFRIKECRIRSAKSLVRRIDTLAPLIRGG